MSDDVGRATSPALRAVMQLVLPHASGSVWGSSLYHPADEGIVALATGASYGGPLDPITPGSGERWMHVLRELITIDLDLAVTAARLWFEAQTIRPSPCAEDVVWAAHAVAVTEVLRGNIVKAERWLVAADCETDPDVQHAWIAETCSKLGLGKDRLVVCP
jgi:hypothetical protein